MKTLIVMRHAKSSWGEPGLPDTDRPLNDRGLRDAPEMGRRLAARGVQLDRIVSSPAKRACQTARLLAEAMGYPKREIVVDDRLYGADMPEWMCVLSTQDNNLDSVLYVGHNPAIADLIEELAPGAVDAVPTAAVFRFELDGEEWAKIARSKPRLVESDWPKKG